MKAVLETEGLRVVFKAPGRGKEIVAIDDLSLRVDEGEVVGFIGPNGAGKTTTIKVLMGFIFPARGSARVLGYAAGSKLARSRTGYMPEVALYYPFMTGEELLRLYGRLQGVSSKQMKSLVPRLLSLVGLAGFEKLRLRSYSRGMMQRVGLAQAIMGDPDLLILDEVSSGLDPVGRRDLRDILTDFKDKGKTVFFSSHELSEVERLCDRIILINCGKVIQIKPLTEILESQRKHTVTIEMDGALPTLPDEIRVTRREERTYEIETGSKEAHLRLMRELCNSGARIIDAESREGSLEDYFVEVIGRKTT